MKLANTLVTKGGGKKCGGEGHAYEEHLAAMKKYYASSSAPQKGKKDGKGKKGPGRGKGKETMAQAQEGAQIEGVPPDVQRFFQMAKDICGTMKEENRTMSIEEWAEVLAISCPGDGCEDPEVFAAMREAGISANDEEEDAPTLVGDPQERCRQVQLLCPRRTWRNRE